MIRRYDIADQAETAALAARLATRLQAGDLLLLEGDLGAGKSTFARALIQARAGAPIEVPSPTFTLLQPYELNGLFLVHADLYRLADPDEARELGLDEMLDKAAILIEWPDRLPALLEREHLRITIEGPFDRQPDRRTITLAASPNWRARLDGLPQ